jgi:adenylate cyclase class IV
MEINIEEYKKHLTESELRSYEHEYFQLECSFNNMHMKYNEIAAKRISDQNNKQELFKFLEENKEHGLLLNQLLDLLYTISAFKESFYHTYKELMIDKQESEHDVSSVSVLMEEMNSLGFEEAIKKLKERLL